jgi:hypothetical protein
MPPHGIDTTQSSVSAIVPAESPLKVGYSFAPARTAVCQYCAIAFQVPKLFFHGSAFFC